MADLTPRITWKIEEYVYREKGPDWYWALGVIAVASAVIAIIRHNTLFAIFILLGAVVLGFFANRRPDIVEIAINEEGVKIRDYLYPFTKLKGFAIDTHELGSYLLIETSRTLMPVIAIPVPETLDTEALIELMRTRLPEKPLKEPFAHKFMEHLGF